MNSVDPQNPFNPINRFDPGNPASPINRYNPNNPFNPMNKFNPANPLNPINRYNPNIPFRPLNTFTGLAVGFGVHNQGQEAVMPGCARLVSGTDGFRIEPPLHISSRGRDCTRSRTIPVIGG